ncbi:MAG: recombination regulator RecX [Candidatus Edwardsbacteria bacterium]|nr:recombination regulator RecX [Candidatus Edwardsbacteria bacterium]MBU1577556.1 recombination regulator RecX [Candidatus Edwardsbacteria bacterium]MBU2462506.1 recombination regulator RecX [Candidatus Edwardsbacteria bacterium]MBU2593651.1 recombination regulator RecX [Candidatus Edwardsbacteria bacterium]
MDINKARNYALRLLALRGRSVKDIRDKLKARAASPADIDLVIDDLLSLGLLDDEKFARDWIENRQHFRPTGVVRLRQELFAKGIDREIVDQAIREYKSNVDEFPAALDLARRKMKLYRKLDADTARRRLAGFLARRGYEGSVVSKVLKTLLKENILE